MARKRLTVAEALRMTLPAEALVTAKRPIDQLAVERLRLVPSLLGNGEIFENAANSKNLAIQIGPTKLTLSPDNVKLLHYFLRRAKKG